MNIMNKVTLKGLLKNKTRTIVTIIGVILSAAMFTAVTTFISSFQNYLVEYTIAEEGEWYGAIYNTNIEAYQTLVNNKKIDTVSLTRSGGFSLLKDSQNDYKPYLHILEIDKQALASLPVHLINGRLPVNENEVLLSEHISSNGGITYQIGDIITLEVGQRTLPDGSIIMDNKDLVVPEEGSSSNTDTDYISENEIMDDLPEGKMIGDGIMYETSHSLEKLTIQGIRSFTVVGICGRLSHKLEPYSAAGYTIITTLDQEAIAPTDRLNAYIKTKDPKEIYNIVEGQTSQMSDSIAFDYNYELLRYVRASNENSFNRVFYSLGAILIALIMVGSISLIYNSFAISVSERKKLFGLLSSTGATAKQRRNSVLFEAFVIAAIGIPIGVLSGIAGIGTTLYILKDIMKSFIASDYPISLSLSVSAPSVIIAVLVALVTILLSAYLPARHSKKVSPLDAIRQTTDIKLTAKQVRTSKLTRRIFGLEADLALKNMKRNRRRYRSTVISLFMSVVLFISASSFATYLKDSVGNVYQNEEYDIAYSIYSKEYEDKSVIGVYEEILSLQGINRGSLVNSTYGSTTFTKDQVQEQYFNRSLELDTVDKNNKMTANLMIYSVDHTNLISYLNELGINENVFYNIEGPAGILVDQQHYYNSGEERYNNTHILKDNSLSALTYYWQVESEKQMDMDITIAAHANQTPFGVPKYSWENSLILVIDREQIEDTFSQLKDQWYGTNMYFTAKDPTKSEQDIKTLLAAEGMPVQSLYNVAESLQSSRNIITIMSVFAYGFITLISLITIANVFNTISTNVNLRRREFAMLKSVGMTNHSFNKMLNYECIFYGLKALLYGLPVSVGVTYLIYQSVENGVDMNFYVPAQSILISIISVFLVVFISMMYSMRKIRKENVLDALKNENL